MNSFRTMSGTLARLSVGAALLALAAVAQAAVEKGAAKVTAVHGTAEISLDGSSWTTLKRGEVLREGAVLRTAAGSVTDLDLGKNGSLLRVMPETTITFSALTFENTGVETIINTKIDLQAGRVLGHVQKLSSVSKYEIKTPKTLATVHGTRYDISCCGNLVVTEGSVVVVAYREDGTAITRVVNARESFSPVSGAVSPISSADELEGPSSIPGITAFPPLQSPFLYDRTVLDRSILPADVVVSRNSQNP